VRHLFLNFNSVVKEVTNLIYLIQHTANVGVAYVKNCSIRVQRFFEIRRRKKDKKFMKKNNKNSIEMPDKNINNPTKKIQIILVTVTVNKITVMIPKAQKKSFKQPR